MENAFLISISIVIVMNMVFVFMTWRENRHAAKVVNMEKKRKEKRAEDKKKQLEA